METKAINPVEFDVPTPWNKESKTTKVKHCPTCYPFIDGKQTEPHEHYISCVQCGSQEKCKVIRTCDAYFPSEMISLPAGWFVGINHDENEEYSVCSPECVAKMFKGEE